MKMQFALRILHWETMRGHKKTAGELRAPLRFETHPCKLLIEVTQALMKPETGSRKAFQHWLISGRMPRVARSSWMHHMAAVSLGAITTYLEDLGDLVSRLIR